MSADTTSTSVWRSTLTLVAFAVLATAIVATTWVATRERIAQNQEAARLAEFAAVLGSVAFDTLNIDAPQTIASPHTLPGTAPVQMFTAKRAGQPVAWVFNVQAQGYGGPIDLMIGITHEVTVSGVRVIAHTETPGLGDDIERERSDWIESFDGMRWRGDTDQRWALKSAGGVFDSFTGASITPRAVVQAVATTVR